MLPTLYYLDTRFRVYIVFFGFRASYTLSALEIPLWALTSTPPVTTVPIQQHSNTPREDSQEKIPKKSPIILIKFFTHF